MDTKQTCNEQDIKLILRHSFIYHRALHFTDNKMNLTKQMKSTNDREKDKLNYLHAKYDSPTEHFAVEITVLF